MNSEINHKNGFTLLEVLVALFILSMIFSILYSAFLPTKKVINILEDRGEYWKVMEGAIQILSHDIRAAAIPSTNKISVFKGDSGEKHRLPIIVFSTYTPYQENGIGRLKMIEYNLEDEPDSKYFFLRRLVYKETQEVVEEEILLDGLSKLELSYFDGEEWKNRWYVEDSKVLPKGVKVSITSKRGEIVSVIPIN